MSDDPTFVLDWLFELKVNSDRSAHKALGWFGMRTGYPVTVTSIVQPWEHKGIRRVIGMTKLDAQDMKAAVFEALILCDRAGGNWTVKGPVEYALREWGFECLSGTPGPAIPEMAAADFRLRRTQ